MTSREPSGKYPALSHPPLIFTVTRGPGALVTARADRLMQFLASEGYRPTPDTGGDIIFRYDGRVYLLRFDPLDQEYLAIAYPIFCPLTTAAELAQAYHAAGLATAGTKVAKVAVYERSRCAWAVVGFFARGTGHCEAMFGRNVAALKAAVSRFEEEMRLSAPPARGPVQLGPGQIERFAQVN